MPPQKKKPKAQKAFERERAEVSQIILDRGESLPAAGVIDQAWLQRWRANEARKAEVEQILLRRGEPLPQGGITDQWLHTWERAEATRILLEQGETPPEGGMTDEWLQLFRAAQVAAEAEAEAQAKGEARRKSAQRRKEAPAKPKNEKAVEQNNETAAERRERLRIAKEESDTKEMECFITAFLGIGDDDSSEDDSSDNDSDSSEILGSMLKEELDSSQDAQATELQQPSVGDLAEKIATKRNRIRILGYKRKGNARKRLQQRQAAEKRAGDEHEIFAETGVDLKDEDQDLNDEEKAATAQNLPAKFRIDSDPRLGELEVDAPFNIDEEERHGRFVETARKIIRFLKLSASAYRELPRETRRGAWKPMVSGMLTLLSRASEDFLLENLLSGIDNPVRSALGNLDFTLEDLVNLPRWPMAKILEKGVYVDILHIKEDVHLFRQLYVGAATGKFGLAQRWQQYLNRRVKHESGKHSKAIMDDNSTVCLRGLAHYDHKSYPWLVCFAETFFMIYLGTITDPGYRPAEGHITEAFINDELYRLVGECRHAAGLPAPLSVGLNTTWSLIQGYRWGDIGSACYNCKRKMVPMSDPSWEPYAFISRDPERPGESMECYNCVVYRRKYGVDRRQSLEERLVFRKTVPIPKTCQNPKCSHKLVPLEDIESYFEDNYEKGRTMLDKCPKTGRWIPRVFQHDDILFGKCYWVCTRCQVQKMGYAHQVSKKKKFSEKLDDATLNSELI